MRTRAPLTLVLVASALFAASCSSASDLSEPEAESSSPVVEKDANYSTIEEFRDAAIEAGLECPSWAERTGSTYAAAAGDCSDSAVLSIFSSESQRDEQVAVLKSITIKGEGQPLLVGPNWMINGPLEDLEAVQPVLGGIVDTSMP